MKTIGIILFLAGTLLTAGQSGNLQNGDFATPIQLPDTTGQIHRLAAFRGNYILLDFWASWCKPCIKQIPHLKRINEKYSTDLPIKVVGVSMDFSKEAWINSLNKHELPWLNLGTGKKHYAAIREAYDVAYVPRTYLIDPQGRIIGIDLNQDELIRRLDSLTLASN
jgi:peroxiredoxin